MQNEYSMNMQVTRTNPTSKDLKMICSAKEMFLKNADWLMTIKRIAMNPIVILRYFMQLLVS